MAHIDPHLALVRPSARYELQLHDLDPEKLGPLGDRYVAEVLDIDERVLIGKILVVTQQMKSDPRDPSSDPNIENRGVIAGVIIRAGSGHLLGLPDWAPQYDGAGRAPADVPMLLTPGDVVLIDYNSKGRALKMAGREIRVINQLDCLVHVEGIRLKRVDNKWEPE